MWVLWLLESRQEKRGRNMLDVCSLSGCVFSVCARERVCMRVEREYGGQNQWMGWVSQPCCSFFLSCFSTIFNLTSLKFSLSPVVLIRETHTGSSIKAIVVMNPVPKPDECICNLNPAVVFTFYTFYSHEPRCQTDLYLYIVCVWLMYGPNLAALAYACVIERSRWPPLSSIHLCLPALTYKPLPPPLCFM